MVFNVNSEENINLIVNSILRGTVNWGDMKELFVKKEKQSKKHKEEYVTVIILKTPKEDILDKFIRHNFQFHENDIVKIDRDTYLKLRNMNIVREVKINK